MQNGETQSDDISNMRPSHRITSSTRDCPRNIHGDANKTVIERLTCYVAFDVAATQPGSIHFPVSVTPRKISSIGRRVSLTEAKVARKP